jgi:hypothetical protein
MLASGFFARYIQCGKKAVRPLAVLHRIAPHRIAPHRTPFRTTRDNILCGLRGKVGQVPRKKKAIHFQSLGHLHKKFWSISDPSTIHTPDSPLPTCLSFQQNIPLQTHLPLLIDKHLHFCTIKKHYT